MGKKKTKARKKEVYGQLLDLRQSIAEDVDEIDDDFTAGQSGNTMMKKFRFQLLHEWLIAEVAPCRAVDIGGGKGLLTYLLNKSGWDVTVVDPAYQELPTKYKDFQSKKRVIIAADEKVPRVSRNFEPAMASEVDLLIGLHAHGCNVQVIDACTKYNTGFVLLPCCVIEEPFYPRRGATWVGSLTDYALREGFDVRPFQLGFRGQNIGIYAPPKS
ncbi:MAG: hypothetical protein RLP44_15000 [Aggregatilineales bacterium]